MYYSFDRIKELCEQKIQTGLGREIADIIENEDSEHIKIEFMRRSWYRMADHDAKQISDACLSQLLPLVDGTVPDTTPYIYHLTYTALFHSDQTAVGILLNAFEFFSTFIKNIICYCASVVANDQLNEGVVPVFDLQVFQK